MTANEALAILGRRGAEKRNRASKLGVLHPTRADRTAFENVEPGPRFWWQDHDD
jgi:hypothetical protein